MALIETPPFERMEKAVCKAIQQRIGEIIEEEVKEASDRIRLRIVTDTAGLAEVILRKMDWTPFGDGKIEIHLGKTFKNKLTSES